MRTLFSVVLSLAAMTLPATGLPMVPAPHEAAAADTVLAQDQEPAVVISDEPVVEEDDPWIFRYLVPTLVAMAALVLAVVAVGYGVRLRGRYRVVR